MGIAAHLKKLVRRSGGEGEIPQAQVAALRGVQIRDHRRALIEAHVDLAKARLLELGAFDQPTYKPGEARIEFMDYYDADALRKAARKAKNRNPETVIEVTHLCQSKRFADSIDERFDLIMAHHVIEHIPDVLTWLNQLEELLSDQGLIVLSIPDRRYTFDILRPVTTIVDLARCQDDDLERPTFWQVLDCVYWHRSVRAIDVWNGRTCAEKVGRGRFRFPEAEAEARRLFAGDPDVHCHVFDYPSFHRLWSAIEESGRSHLKVLATHDVLKGGNEFHVVLGRSVLRNPDQG